MKPYSDAGVIVGDQTYIGMQARLRIVVRVPSSMGKPGGDLPGNFEPDIRQAVADKLEGLKVGWFEVDYVAVEQFQDSEVSAMHHETDLIFGASSIYGARTRKGMVEVTFGAEKHHVTPSKAREMATGLLEAAASAEGDEVLLRVLDRAGISQQRAGHILMAMRQERAFVDRKARAEMRRAIAEDQEAADLGN